MAQLSPSELPSPVTSLSMSAWVELNGLKAATYSVSDRVEGEVRGWLVSSVGVKVSVGFRLEMDQLEFELQLVASVDGQVIGRFTLPRSHKLLRAPLTDNDRERRIKYVRINNDEVCDVELVAVEKTNDEALACSVDTALAIGEIKLEVYSQDLKGTAGLTREFDCGPIDRAPVPISARRDISERAALSAPRKHKSTGGQHYPPVEKLRRRIGPVATFVWHYGSAAVLERAGALAPKAKLEPGTPASDRPGTLPTPGRSRSRSSAPGPTSARWSDSKADVRSSGVVDLTKSSDTDDDDEEVLTARLREAHLNTKLIRARKKNRQRSLGRVKEEQLDEKPMINTPDKGKAREVDGVPPELLFDRRSPPPKRKKPNKSSADFPQLQPPPPQPQPQPLSSPSPQPQPKLKSQSKFEPERILPPDTFSEEEQLPPRRKKRVDPKFTRTTRRHAVGKEPLRGGGGAWKAKSRGKS